MTLLPAHNAIELWSWGEHDSHLGRGCDQRRADRRLAAEQQRPGAAADARAARRGRDHPRADPGPADARAGPADPALRQAVRLTGARRLMDPLYQQPLLEVQWAPEDALGFDLAVTAGGHPCSQASGNVVLVANGVAETDTIELSAPTLTRAGLSYADAVPGPAGRRPPSGARAALALP